MGEGFLDGFRRDMQEGDALGNKEIAARLYDHLAADRDRLKAPIADLFLWTFNVEIELKTGAMWTVECLGADAYHVYPAHIREDGSVVWPNIWVAPDMKLDEMIAQVREEVFNKQE
jgi:hypothetical protein